MKYRKSIVIAGTIVTVAGALGNLVAWLTVQYLQDRNDNLQGKNDKMRENIRVFQLQLDQLRHMPREIRRRFDRLGQDPYRLPSSEVPTIVMTTAGRITLRVADGMYVGTGIFVDLPQDMPFSPELAAAFKRATDDEFHLDLLPDANQSDNHHAIVTAGLDINLYNNGVRGYFGFSWAPRVDKTAANIRRVVNKIHAQRARLEE